MSTAAEWAIRRFVEVGPGIAVELTCRLGRILLPSGFPTCRGVRSTNRKCATTAPGVTHYLVKSPIAWAAVSWWSRFAMTPTELRLQLLRLGYLPLPLYGKEPPNRKNNKRGGLSDWPNIRATPDLILKWDKKWPDARNSGVITAPVPAFDGDITHPEAARAVEDLVRERYEEVGRLLVRFGNPPKFAIPFRTDEPFEKLSVYLKARDGSRPQDRVPVRRSAGCR